ncbi:hypothetical protein H0O03_01495 [Candidatus Micrarchaeota archaeon]|nr:hypothetical protein [Candidatus Micrarchaeota archaeon]
MTVIGDDLLHNCAECYFQHGFSVKLSKRGEELVCSRNSAHRYRIKEGFLQKL